MTAGRAPGIPARVTDIAVGSGRRLRTARGTLDELASQAAAYGEDYLRVRLREPVRAGLRDDAVEILPNALEVRIDPEFAVPTRGLQGVELLTTGADHAAGTRAASRLPALGPPRGARARRGPRRDHRGGGTAGGAMRE